METDKPDNVGIRIDLEAARGCGFITTPVGSKLTVHDLAGGSEKAFESIIQDCNREMAISINGTYLQMMESKISSPSGDTTEHMNISESQQWDLAAAVSAVLTEQIGPKLVDENFNAAGYPLLKLGDLDTKFSAARLDLFDKLRKAGLPTRRSQWYDTAGADDPAGDETDTLPGMAGGPTPTVPGPPNLRSVPSRDVEYT